MGTKYFGTALNVPEKQAFVGSHNFEKALRFVEPYFEQVGVEEILLFGASAGGFGVYTNFMKVERIFPDAKLTVINDSGPVFEDLQAFSPCLQIGFAAIYGIRPPQGFISATMFQDGLLSHIYRYSSDRYPDVNFGFVTSLEDEVSRFFLSFGYDNCTGAPDNQLPADIFRNSLIRLRDNFLIPDTRWSTYFVDNSTHVQMVETDPFYIDETEGTKLYEWVGRLLDGEEGIHIAP